jgi:hypothetical protein
VDEHTALYLVVLSSGEFGGTTLTEMRERWSAADLFDAIDHVAWMRATAWANRPKK